LTTGRPGRELFHGPSQPSTTCLSPLPLPFLPRHVLPNLGRHAIAAVSVRSDVTAASLVADARQPLCAATTSEPSARLDLAVARAAARSSSAKASSLATTTLSPSASFVPSPSRRLLLQSSPLTAVLSRRLSLDCKVVAAVLAVMTMTSSSSSSSQTSASVIKAGRRHARRHRAQNHRAVVLVAMAYCHTTTPLP